MKNNMANAQAIASADSFLLSYVLQNRTAELSVMPYHTGITMALKEQRAGWAK
jgi:hypothetical protein